MPELSRLAILDDYQGVARALGPWDRLPDGLRIEVFRDTLSDPDALADRLRPFDALVIMRERTPFPRALIERLPNLRLLVTTAARNRSVDVAACAERGITVCGTPSAGNADGGPHLGADPLPRCAASRSRSGRCAKGAGRSRSGSGWKARRSGCWGSATSARGSRGSAPPSACGWSPGAPT